MHLYPSLAVGRLILTGADRVKFLHSFCTADIKRMQVGDVREAFVLNVKGKLLGHVHVLCRESSLELVSWPIQTETLHTHLDRYVIREQVQFHRADLDDAAFLFGSPEDKLNGLDLAPSRSWREIETPEGKWIVAAGEFCGPGWLVLPSDSLGSSFSGHPIVSASLKVATPGELEFWRVSHAFPQYGVDSNEETLPQELQRDDQAISFDKGCYLGQETVARIDSLGHVNRLLVRVSTASESALKLPAELRSNDSPVGLLTSLQAHPPGVEDSCLDIGSASHPAIGLATLKRSAAKKGERLQVDGFEFTVV